MAIDIGRNVAASNGVYITGSAELLLVRLTSDTTPTICLGWSRPF